MRGYERYIWWDEETQQRVSAPMPPPGFNFDAEQPYRCATHHGGNVETHYPGELLYRKHLPYKLPAEEL